MRFLHTFPRSVSCVVAEALDAMMKAEGYVKGEEVALKPLPDLAKWAELGALSTSGYARLEYLDGLGFSDRDVAGHLGWTAKDLAWWRKDLVLFKKMLAEDKARETREAAALKTPEEMEDERQVRVFGPRKVKAPAVTPEELVEL